MGMKIFLIIGIGIVLAFLVVKYGFLFVPEPVSPEVILGGKIYSVELATTAEEQALGLGERDALCEQCAMLFLFQDVEEHAFWMKGMRFPLDIAWLLDGRVVHIEHRVPNDSMTVYAPSGKSNQVLEFNAGVLDAVRVGDRLLFSF